MRKAQERVSTLTGVSKSTILRVVKETDGTPDRTVPDRVEPISCEADNKNNIYATQCVTNTTEHQNCVERVYRILWKQEQSE